MSETARERVAKSSGVTADMVSAAEGVLEQLGITRLSKKMDTRDVLWEVIRAALVVGGRVPVDEGDSVAKDEAEWMQYFGKCVVVVRDPEVGRQLLKIGTESTEAFGAIVDTIAQNRGLVVPLEKYPGISLFKKQTKPKGKVSDEVGPDQGGS